MTYRPPRVTCKGTTKQGKSCKRPPRPGADYCREHLVVELAPLGTDVEIARRVEEHEQTLRVRPGTEIVNPVTGEIFTLGDADNSDLHGLLVDLRLYVESLQTARRLVEDQLHERMDAAARWTIDTDYGRLKGSSPKPVRVIPDPLALRSRLLELGLAEATVDAAVEKVVPPVRYVPRAAGLNALLKVEAPAAVIDSATVWEKPGHRAVTLDTRRPTR